MPNACEPGLCGTTTQASHPLGSFQARGTRAMENPVVTDSGHEAHGPHLAEVVDEEQGEVDEVCGTQECGQNHQVVRNGQVAGYAHAKKQEVGVEEAFQ